MGDQLPGDIVACLHPPTGRISGPDIVSELRRVLVSGEVEPGSQIPVDDVARRLGVSRIPVREALKTLQGEGLLTHRPRGGYTVTALSPDELSELYLVRGALEAAAISAATRRATDQDRDRARSALARQEGTAGTPQYQRLSREFHEALLAPSRMPRLLNMLDIAWNLTEPVQSMMRITAAERAALDAEHQAMLQAFVAGDEQALHQLTIDHHQRLTAAVENVDPTAI